MSRREVGRNGTMAKKSGKQPQESAAIVQERKSLPFKKNAFRDWFEVIMYGLALLMFLKGFIFQNFQIPTKSMENSLLIGDHLTANKFIFAPNRWEWEKKVFPQRGIRRGDVIVFKFPGDEREDYIKRCIGLPGDQVAIINDRVYINGELLEEPYTYFKDVSDPSKLGRDPKNRYRPKNYDTQKPGLENGVSFFISRSLEEILEATRQTFHKMRYSKNPLEREFFKKLESARPDVIPEGFYLMLGDNRNLSKDSRFWGLVPQAYIEGRAYFVWWSYGEDEGSHQLKGFDLVMSYLRVPFYFWTRTRVPESFSLIK